MPRLLRKKRTESMGERGERDGASTGARGGLPDLWRYLRSLWMAGRGVRRMTRKEYAEFVEARRAHALHRLHRRVGDHAEDVFQEAVISFLTERGDPPVPEYAKYPSPTAHRRVFPPVFWKRLHARLVDYIRARTQGTWGLQTPLQKWDDIGGPEVPIPLSLSLLTEPQRRVFTLLMQGLTEEVIAAELGITQPAVSNLKKRGRRRLVELGKELRQRVAEV